MDTFAVTLQQRLDEAAVRHDVPGAAVAVGHGDTLVEAATGVLNVETRTPVTPESVFLVGSVTKPWTAALVLQLVDDGLVELDQPVRRYLPEFGLVDDATAARVTVRHLLSHTGGFTGDLFADTGSGDDALDRYLEHLHTAAEPVHPPGELFSYCNAGYNVLGALAARVRGDTWEAVVQERLFAPLGATLVTVSPAEPNGLAMASGHGKPRGADAPGVVPDWRPPRSNGPAGTRLGAAPRELVRLGRMLLNGGSPVLSPQSVAAMRTPQVPLPGATGRGARHWGLGLALLDWGGTPVFGHDGNLPGLSTMWYVLPGHDLVVALCGNSNNISGLFDDVLVPAIQEQTGVVVPPRPVPPTVPASPPRNGTGAGTDLTRYAGRYAIPLMDFEVTVDGGDLVVTTTPRGLAAAAGDPPSTHRYVRLADETFIATEPEYGSHSTITFVHNGRYLHSMRAAPRIA
jgi:CubicO group peptidase (beta-lactamase class C family)